jgi:hypothetical protein
VVLLASCGGRTPLDVPGQAPLAGDDAGQDASVPDDAPPEAAPDAVEATPPSQPPPSSDPCAGMPPIPCPGGGFEYCVAGHYSQCPKRCGACVPGSTRVCFITYCKAWGTQTCAADGLAFGPCQESAPPSQCASLAEDGTASAALEQCCIDGGHCCKDTFDLNGNGDTNEQLGNCSGTTCS